MKILKVEDNKVYFSTNKSSWILIDKITKDDLLKLMDLTIEKKVGMDDFDADKINNQAHQIIYKNIYNKFKELLEDNKRFKDQSELLYKEAIEKYKTKSVKDEKSS